MNNDLNAVKVQNDKLGKYMLVLSNEQLKNIGKDGAYIIEAEAKKNQQKTTKSGRIIISPDSQKNNKDGFIGNTIDWSQFFPNEENEKIPELIEKAKKWEDNFELTLITLTTFIGTGLGIYTFNRNFNQFINIIGPFVDKHAIDNPKINKNLKKILENLYTFNSN